MVDDRQRDNVLTPLAALSRTAHIRQYVRSTGGAYVPLWAGGYCGLSGGLMSEDFDLKYRAAWSVFTETCGNARAPEATFQVWFAHYLISQFGIDRVAREPNFNFRTATSGYRRHFQKPDRTGGEVRLDAVVARLPGIDLPHYALREDAEEGGMDALAGMAVIGELKVASTARDGLDHTEVCLDFWKLSMLLEEAKNRVLPVPLAYVGVVDNHSKKAYNFDHLLSRLAREGVHPGVKLLRASRDRP
jgi:hypothetical protein